MCCMVYELSLRVIYCSFRGVGLPVHKYMLQLLSQQISPYLEEILKNVALNR